MMTVVLMDSGRPIWLSDFDDVVANRYRAYLGNDHYIDVLAFDIPILNQYGYWTSPPTFAFSRVFFGKENEQFGRAWFVLTQFNPRMARLEGVRMVVTDAPAIPGGTLIYETKAGDTFLRLFRLADTNVGQYSPMNAVRIASATEAVSALKDPAFDPMRDVVVEDEVPANLQAAKSVNVTVDRGASIKVQAASGGTSLLVLPFDYSHCLRIKSEGGNARLIPVNLNQTGLLFESSVEAEITYRFGFFGDATCRGLDIQRADKLDLKDMLLANHRATVTHSRPTLW